MSDCCVKPAVGLAEDADIPLTPTLSHRERGNREGSPFGLQGEIVNILLKIKNSFLPTKQILIGL